MPAVELLLDARATIGESPIWSASEGTLYWIDIKEPALHRLHPDGTRRRWPLGGDVGAFALCADGAGAVVALRKGIHRLDLETGATRLLAPSPFDPSLFRFNEGICDAAGRFWVGVMFDPLPGHEGPPQRAAMHSFTLAGGLAAGRDRSDLHNGFAWGGDGATLYWSHSYEGQVCRAPYDVRSGALGVGEPFCAIGPDGGIPDGAAMDEEGCLWCAVHGGGVLHRYDPSGRLLSVVTLPVSQPTMCAFVGPGLEEMVVTSASDGLSAGERAREPLAGGLFRLRPGVRGLPRPCVVR